MPVNKVEYKQSGVTNTLLDLTGDTAVEADVIEGKTFHKADGSLATGTNPGGAEPAAYLKTASVSNGALTITDKNDTPVVYTPDVDNETIMLLNGKLKSRVGQPGIKEVNLSSEQSVISNVDNGDGTYTATFANPLFSLSDITNKDAWRFVFRFKFADETSSCVFSGVNLSLYDYSSNEFDLHNEHPGGGTSHTSFAVFKVGQTSVTYSCNSASATIEKSLTSKALRTIKLSNNWINYDPNTLFVNGSGNLAVKPDIARPVFWVEYGVTTFEDIRTAVNNRMTVCCYEPSCFPWTYNYTLNYENGEKFVLTSLVYNPFAPLGEEVYIATLICNNDNTWSNKTRHLSFGITHETLTRTYAIIDDGSNGGYLERKS